MEHFYDFPFSWRFHHPNWLSLHHFSEEVGLNHQPGMVNTCSILQMNKIYGPRLQKVCSIFAAIKSRESLRWPSPGNSLHICFNMRHVGKSFLCLYVFIHINIWLYIYMYIYVCIVVILYMYMHLYIYIYFCVKWDIHMGVAAKWFEPLHLKHW